MLIMCARNVYGKVIADEEQPLLIHRPKRKDRRDEVCFEPSIYEYYIVRVCRQWRK